MKRQTKNSLEQQQQTDDAETTMSTDRMRERDEVKVHFHSTYDDVNGGRVFYQKEFNIRWQEVLTVRPISFESFDDKLDRNPEFQALKFIPILIFIEKEKYVKKLNEVKSSVLTHKVQHDVQINSSLWVINYHRISSCFHSSNESSSVFSNLQEGRHESFVRIRTETRD